MKIGHVYRVERINSLKNNPEWLRYYYCTIIKIKGIKRAYIPNELDRPLDKYLTDRMRYIGPYRAYGSLLFNQNLPWHMNKYNTNFVFLPWLSIKILLKERLNKH